jgi:hypothetical protein
LLSVSFAVGYHGDLLMKGHLMRRRLNERRLRNEPAR